MENQEFECSELNWLILEQHFLVGINLRNYPMAMKHYVELKKNINIGYPLKRRTILRLMLLSFKSEEYYSEVEKEIIDFKVGTEDFDHYLDVAYWKLLILINGRNYLKVYDIIIENSLTNDIRFVGMLLYVADYINDEIYRNKAVEIAEKFEYQDTDAFHYKFIRFLILKLTTEKQHQVIDYLKYNILPGRNTYYHHLYSKAYEDYYLNYLCKSSKYKEAVSFLTKQMAKYRT